MQRYAELTDKPNMSPRDRQEAIALQLSIRNKLTSLKINTLKREGKGSDRYVLIQATLQAMTVTRDSATLVALETGDRAEAQRVYDYTAKSLQRDAFTK